MKDDDGRLTELRRDNARLAVRVGELERLLVTSLCLAIGVTVLAGLLLPFSIETGDREERFSTLTFPFRILADPREELDGEEVALLIGFLGLLLVCALLLTVVLPVIARGTLGRGYRRFASVVVAVATVGSGAVVLMSLSFADEGRVEVGPGGFVLLAGTAAAFSLLTARMTGLVGPPEAGARSVRRYGSPSRLRADEHLRAGEDTR